MSRDVEHTSRAVQFLLISRDSREVIQEKFPERPKSVDLPISSSEIVDRLEFIIDNSFAGHDH